MPKTLLIIGFVWPESQNTAAGTRMLQLITLFKSFGYNLTFCSASNKNEHSDDLSALHVNEVEIKLNDSSFDEFIKNLNPEVVVFDRYLTEEHYSWRVAKFCPNAIRILDTEDLHSLRKYREQVVKKDIEFTINDYKNQDITKRELASIYRSDLSLIISEYEYNWLISEFKISTSLLFYLPFILSPADFNNITPSFNLRKHFISIGNFLHAPNFDAVLYLNQHIWPQLKQRLPDAEMHIYGAYCPDKIKVLNNPTTGFIVNGYAASVDAVMKLARVNLAALRFGAGLKGKVIDAIKNSTPTIVSPIAAEGIFEDNYTGYANTDYEFIEKAVELYTNQQKWFAANEMGKAVMVNKFPISMFDTALEAAILNIQQNYKSHRSLNFIGQMLMHHTLQSTKHLSQWIELKSTLNR